MLGWRNSNLRLGPTLVHVCNIVQRSVSRGTSHIASTSQKVALPGQLHGHDQRNVSSHACPERVEGLVSFHTGETRSIRTAVQPWLKQAEVARASWGNHSFRMESSKSIWPAGRHVQAAGRSYSAHYPWFKMRRFLRKQDPFDALCFHCWSFLS